MRPWRQAALRALVSGSAASVASSLVLALRGRREVGSAAGPNNGPSQWIYGRQAAYHREASVKHTLVGYLIHHLSAYGWALLHERFFGGSRAAARSPLARLGQAATTAVVANLVDFKLTPKRLRPGFEVQLSRKSLLLVYGAVAAGLFVGTSIARRRQKTSRRL